jgi:glycosyltransferase involved in cell wall biosynthesis
MRRIVLLAPFPPRSDASHGGSRVMAQLIAWLAGRHEVALLLLRGADDPPVEPCLEQKCALVEEFPRQDRRRSRSLRERLRKDAGILASPFTGRPAWARACAVPALGERLRALVRDWRPQIVQAEYSVMGQYLAGLDGAPLRRILVEYEPGAPAARERWRSARGRDWIEHGLDRLAWERFERRVARQADAVVTFTERDRCAVLARAPGTQVVTIPFGTAVPDRPLDPLGQPPPAVLFVGSFRHPPNVDAAVRLAERIFPLVRQRCPGAVLHLVGEEPPARLREAGPDVVVAGRVPSVDPWLDRAAVVVAPLSSGGGMRVKVTEALAAGKALVASPLAVEGLDVRDECEGGEVLLARSDEDFAAAIVALIAEPERRAALASRARDWARAHLSWESCFAAWEDLYGRLLEGRA